MDGRGTERIETVVIGAGQAGLSAGYQLRQEGRPFVIVDANERVGGSWLNRYDSLKLFTPPWAVKLPGWRYPTRPRQSRRPRQHRPPPPRPIDPVDHPTHTRRQPGARHKDKA